MSQGRIFIILLMMITMVVVVEAQDQSTQMTIKGRINDYAGIISNSQKHQLHQILQQHQFAKKHNITVMTVISTADESPSDYAEKLLQGVESAKRPNTVLLLLLKNDREAIIVSGKEIRKIISKAEFQRIIDESVASPMQREDYDHAALEGVKAIMSLLSR